MPKGFFTQSACVLLSQPTTLDAIIPLLSEFKIARRIDKPTESHMGTSSLVLEYRPEVNGHVTIETRAGKWPDTMGDAKGDPELFAAWSTGFYGPFAFPGGYHRAKEQLTGWPAGREIADRHQAAIHIKATYVLGVEKEATILPPDYRPLAELQFVTRIALALLQHPDALCYFNPNGEVLRDKALMEDSLKYHEQHKIPPFELWSNLRLFNPNSGWMIMDTVGMGQLDLPDLEACFPAKKYDTGKVSYFLRNCCFYLLNNGEVIKSSETMNGPGNINWQAWQLEKPVCPPPRRVIRWFPQDGSKPPATLFPPELKPPASGLLSRLFGRGK